MSKLVFIGNVLVCCGVPDHLNKIPITLNQDAVDINGNPLPGYVGMYTTHIGSYNTIMEERLSAIRNGTLKTKVSYRDGLIHSNPNC